MREVINKLYMPGRTEVVDYGYSRENGEDIFGFSSAQEAYQDANTTCAKGEKLFLFRRLRKENLSLIRSVVIGDAL